MAKARKYHSDLLQEILDRTSLETSLRVSFEMNDVNNWKNGDYLGNKKLIKAQVKSALRIIEDWKENGFINPIRIKDEIK